MTSACLERRLLDLDRSLRPGSAELAAVLTKGRELGAHLTASSGACIDADIGGSIARGTKLHPIEDMDLICRLNSQRCDAAGSPELILRRLRDIVDTAPGIEAAAVGDAVVTAFAPRLTIDVVPLIRASGAAPFTFWRKGGGPHYETVVHDPAAQIAAAEAQDEACGGRYRATVRLFKHWNRLQGKPLPRSYMAETLVWHAIRPTQPIPDALRAVLVFTLGALKGREFLADPGNPQDNVLGGFPISHRREAIAAVERAAAILKPPEVAVDADIGPAYQAYGRLLSADLLAASPDRM